MSEPQNTKQHLLSELESIKTLLHEDDWDEIPVLQDSVDHTQANVSDEALELDESVIPTLEELADSFSNNHNENTETSDEDTDDSDIEILQDSYFSEIEDLNSSEAEGFNLKEAEDSGLSEAEGFDFRETEDSNLDEEHSAPEDSGADWEAPLDSEGLYIDHDLKINNPPPSETETLEQKNQEHALPEGVLPGQRSLFDDQVAGSTPLSTEPAPTPAITLPPRKTSGENPFLPKHIRDRLHINRSLVEVIESSVSDLAVNQPKGAKPSDNKLTGSTIAVSQAQPSTKEVSSQEPSPPASQSDSLLSTEQQQELIDQLVKDHLPFIEAELRQRLSKTLDTELSKRQSSDNKDR